MHHSTHRKRALFSSFCARPMVRLPIFVLSISSSLATTVMAEQITALFEEHAIPRWQTRGREGQLRLRRPLPI